MTMFNQAFYVQLTATAQSLFGLVTSGKLWSALSFITVHPTALWSIMGLSLAATIGHISFAVRSLIRVCIKQVSCSSITQSRHMGHCCLRPWWQHVSFCPSYYPAFCSYTHWQPINGLAQSLSSGLFTTEHLERNTIPRTHRLQNRHCSRQASKQRMARPKRSFQSWLTRMSTRRKIHLKQLELDVCNKWNLVRDHTFRTPVHELTNEGIEANRKGTKAARRCTIEKEKGSAA